MMNQLEITITDPPPADPSDLPEIYIDLFHLLVEKSGRYPELDEISSALGLHRDSVITGLLELQARGLIECHVFDPDGRELHRPEDVHLNEDPKKKAPVEAEAAFLVYQTIGVI
jgi:hypothetical protein